VLGDNIFVLLFKWVACFFLLPFLPPVKREELDEFSTSPGTIIPLLPPKHEEANEIAMPTMRLLAELQISTQNALLARVGCTMLNGVFADKEGE